MNIETLDSRSTGQGWMVSNACTYASPVIWKLYIHPDHQGAGIGGKLLESLVEAVPTGCRAVSVEYADGNDRAAAVYVKHGFIETRRDRADQPDWPDQVWAELALPGPATG